MYSINTRTDHKHTIQYRNPRTKRQNSHKLKEYEHPKLKSDQPHIWATHTSGEEIPNPESKIQNPKAIISFLNHSFKSNSNTSAELPRGSRRTTLSRPLMPLTTSTEPEEAPEDGVSFSPLI